MNEESYLDARILKALSISELMQLMDEYPFTSPANMRIEREIESRQHGIGHLYKNLTSDDEILNHKYSAVALEDI